MWNPTLPESQASKAKDKYRVTNWSEYDRALVRRGDITRHSAPNQVKNTLNCVYQLRNLEPLPQSQMRWVFQFFAGIHVLLILKKSVELNPAENIQHKLDKPTGAMIFV
jgi:hypothetical protein